MADYRMTPKRGRETLEQWKARQIREAFAANPASHTVHIVDSSGKSRLLGAVR